MYSLTIFKSIYDNLTHRRLDFSSWEELEALLYKLASRPLARKKDAELICSATYVEGTTRANANVIEWARWAAVDVDQPGFAKNPQEELKALYGDWYYVCYSTASSTDEHPKFRLVFPLKSAVKQEHIAAFWYALNIELESMADVQTKDLSRMFYSPGDYANSNKFIFTNEGSYIDPDVLMTRHPIPVKQGKTMFDRLPDEMQKRIIQYQKDQMENCSISWTSYSDCPFVSKAMLRTYNETTLVTDTGRYHAMYKVMVSIAMNAIAAKYPITANEIAQLCRELDVMTGNRYENRNLELEADRAIEYSYKNKMI